GEPDTRRGFIFDGFPRNLAQAHALERLLEALQQPLDAVVQFDVDYRELVRRISGRRSCADCGRVFNMLTSPPPSSESCPRTGAASPVKTAARKRASVSASRARAGRAVRRKRTALRSSGSKAAAKTARAARGKSPRLGRSGRGRLKGKRR